MKIPNIELEAHQDDKNRIRLVNKDSGITSRWFSALLYRDGNGLLHIPDAAWNDVRTINRKSR